MVYGPTLKSIKEDSNIPIGNTSQALLNFFLLKLNRTGTE